MLFPGLPSQPVTFRTRMARSVFQTLFQPPPPRRNELFEPGRMAFVMDLEEDDYENEIPSALVRSKADVIKTSTQRDSTNDIVITKLTQILSYLRQGRRKRKKEKKVKPLPAKDAVHQDTGLANVE